MRLTLVCSACHLFVVPDVLPGSGVASVDTSAHHLGISQLCCEKLCDTNARHHLSLQAVTVTVILAAVHCSIFSSVDTITSHVYTQLR
jgi:hypothetical protein